MTSLENRTVLITGAGRGLGAAIAQLLYRHGANIALAEISREVLSGDPAAADADARILHLQCDVRQEHSAQDAIQATVERFGGLDVLINNAGVDVTDTVDALSMQQWDDVINTNLRGPVLMTKLALPHLRRSDDGRGGHIVNIGSTAALRAWPNAAAYHASKWGLLGMSRALYAELRRGGIRVSSIIAGGMRTPFLLERFPDIDQSRLQDPANVAMAVHFVLCMPRESIVPELMVLPLQEASWPLRFKCGAPGRRFFWTRTVPWSPMCRSTSIRQSCNSRPARSARSNC